MPEKSHLSDGKDVVRTTETARLKEVSSRLLDVAARLHAAGLLPGDEAYRLKLDVKPVARLQRQSVEAIRKLRRHLEAKIEHLEARLTARVAEGSTGGFKRGVVSEHGCDMPESDHTDVDQQAVSSPAVLGRAPAGSVRRVPVASTWGKHAEQEPKPSGKTVVARTRPSKSQEDATIRAMLVAPILRNAMTSEECAAAWRRLFRGDSASPLALFDIPKSYHRKYRNLSGRSLRRWADKVRRAECRAFEAGIVAAERRKVLQHEISSSERPIRVATPAVVAKVQELFGENKDWTAVQIAGYLNHVSKIKISVRTVQKIVAERISDVERARLRGGPGYDDGLFRSRLIREAPYPNHTWIMDHSFLHQECIDPGYVGDSNDFDFEFEFVTEEPSIGGHNVTRRRVQGLWITVVKDACTRRRLAVRIWPHAPDTRMTMLAVRDAMLRFGVPEVLYTDNGSDFRSRELQEALHAAGIHHAFSIPYTPEGRGKIEREFRTIKEGVLSLLPGFYGGKYKAGVTHDDDLFTLHKVESLITQYLEAKDNEIHSETRRKPSEHFACEVGARCLPPANRAIPLLIQKTVKKRSSGVVLNKRRYYCAAMGSIQHGTELLVHYDPIRWKTVHVSVETAGGQFEWLGVAEYYDKDNPPPEASEVRRGEVAFRRDVAVQVAEQRERASKARRLAAVQDEAIHIAEALLPGHRTSTGGPRTAAGLASSSPTVRNRDPYADDEVVETDNELSPMLSRSVKSKQAVPQGVRDNAPGRSKDEAAALVIPFD